MKAKRALAISAIAVFAGCAQLVRVPPGTTVELALARKPEVLKMPQQTQAGPQQGRSQRSRTVYVPPVEPTLPTNDSVTAAAEAYTRGRLALGQDRTADAITAFKQAVQIDPQFNEAWQSLAMAYEKAGQGDKARDAFRHSKDLAQH